MKLLRSVVLVAGLALAVCGEAGARQDLASAPHQVIIEGRALELEADVWLNLMPPTRENPLIVVARLVGQDSIPVDRSLSMPIVWITSGDLIWTGETESRSLSTPFLEAVARGGPRWQEGLTLEVVVQIVDSSGTKYLLKTGGVRLVAAR